VGWLTSWKRSCAEKFTHQRIRVRLERAQCCDEGIGAQVQVIKFARGSSKIQNPIKHARLHPQPQPQIEAWKLKIICSLSFEAWRFCSGSPK
jgi:hypothetical protein